MSITEYDCIQIAFPSDFTGYCKIQDNGCDIYSPDNFQMVTFFHCTFGDCQNFVGLLFFTNDPTNVPIYSCGSGEDLATCLIPAIKKKNELIALGKA